MSRVICMLDNVGWYLSGFLCVKGFFFLLFAINTVWEGILELYNFLKVCQYRAMFLYFIQ